MNIEVKRIYKGKDYTIGNLYIDGQYFCDTLEDTDRGLKDSQNLIDIKDKKIFGQTAIPTGEYNVNLTFSQRFKRILPILLNVKGFDGIRIHSGNVANDTEGCILVGRNTVKGMVTQSQDTMNKLMAKLVG